MDHEVVLVLTCDCVSSLFHWTPLLQLWIGLWIHEFDVSSSLHWPRLLWNSYPHPC